MKTGLISKIIKTCIIVLIPLLSGFGVGFYAYGYYENRFFDYYMSKASEENTEDRLISYLKFANENLEYTQENGDYNFYLKEKVSNEHGDLFTISIIRAADVRYEEYTNKIGTVLGKRNNYYVTYYFAVYNVNYDALAKTLDPSGEHKLLYTELPTLSAELIDAADEDIKTEFDFSTVATETGKVEGGNIAVVYDYGYSPEKDSKGDKLNANNPTSMRYYVVEGKSLEKFSSDINIKIEVNSNWSGTDQTDPVEVANINKKDFYNNKAIQDSKELKDMVDDDFEDVYGEDIFAAGYTKFVFVKYIWWESLIAILLVGVVCVSFVLVWNAEEEKEVKKAKGKKK